MAGATLIVGVSRLPHQRFLFHVAQCADNAPGRDRAAGLGSGAGHNICGRHNWIWLRLRRADASLDRALFVAALLNVFCHVTMSQSQQVLDAPATMAHVLMVMSYVVVLGGTLLDNAQLFDQVSRLAASDSLTGLANHRRLLEVLENEIQRSRRTGRSFAVAPVRSGRPEERSTTNTAT